MICTEVAGMKRILVKIVLPVSLLAVWMITCYPICRKAEGFDFFLYCRWSDWRCGCNSENGYGADGDNKDNQ